ncbi:trypsin-like serine proteases [Gracilibacillus boraciitolerans JCM 21714]|uniref:Trypsin-like serine proteases n=1 Tax=Gracilibacillus boraciitolerans JCM 21714 TaxID=1298598 RepID=W4VGD3_9BACI|nr:S1C family serine protease [Gracilibacillus boraciitolerans]GAE91829.1 trypsin-like serine proteases [Gracilibacillus boraciitolerans JCM 21714]
MYKRRKYIPVILAVFILLIAITLAFLIYRDWYKQPLSTENTLATNIENNYNEVNLKTIIHQTQKSVVQIETTNDLTSKTGSGFVINNTGDILTNAHVIEDADTIMVKLSNTRQYPAAVIGIGVEEDFAVIRVPELHQLEPISLETEKQIEIGDEVIAIGSPVGIQNSVSLGLIVGTDRSFSINNFQYDEVYQISANITYGNSGGPLILRSSGKVIGINSAGIADTDIGFSIPVTQVNKQITNWIEDVKEEDLVYLSSIGQRVNQEKLEEDALYLIDYFFENISLRDYVNAYSMLGSHYQDKNSYITFRRSFQSLISLNTKKKTITEKKDDEIHMTVDLEATLRDDSYQETQRKWQYNLVVGFENDQLKILKLHKTS